MSRPFYSFRPVDGANADLNEALREIDDSFRALREDTQLAARFGIQPFVAKQFYAKFGFNPDVDNSSVPEDVWPEGTTLAFPSTAASASVVSDDAADAAAGTGARELVLQGVTGSYDFVEEVIVPNGTSPVLTTGSFLFVHRVFVRACGSNGTNVGRITVTIGGSLVQSVEPGKGQTESSHIVVPNALYAGEVPYITSIDCRCGKNANAWALIELRTQAPNEGARVRQAFVVESGGPVDFTFNGSPPRLVPGERVWLRVTEVSSNNTAVSGGTSIVYLNAPIL